MAGKTFLTGLNVDAIVTDPTTLNVGIGGAASTYKLDVTGTGRFTSDLTSSTIKSTYSGTTNWNSFGNQLFIGVNGANNNFLSDNMYYNSGWLFANAGAGAQIYFGASAAGSIDFRTAPTGAAGGTPSITNRMTILQGGNVGIGTSSPAYTLDVLGSINSSGFININATDNAILNLNRTTTSQYGFVRYGTAGTYYWRVGLESNGTNDFVFANEANAERMRITSGGNVLIGTTTDVGASYKLQVAGDGYFTKVTPSIRLNGTPFGNSGANIQLLGWASGNYNWQISTAMFSSGLELSASSTTGGSTFSTAIGLFSPSTGAYSALSDSTKKKDFEPSTIGLKEILQLKPTLFRMKSENGNAPKQLGFIAQEVKPFIPQAYVEEGSFIGLNDRPIVAALVKTVQEQNQLITDLTNRLDKLENK